MRFSPGAMTIGFAIEKKDSKTIDFTIGFTIDFAIDFFGSNFGH